MKENVSGCFFSEHSVHMFYCCSKARSDGKIETQSSSPSSGYLISGRSLPLPGHSSLTGSSTSSQSISNTHSLSLPNLQQHCTDAVSFINDAINTEWVSLMTSMNLGEVADVTDSADSRSVNSTPVFQCCLLYAEEFVISGHSLFCEQNLNGI